MCRGLCTVLKAIVNGLDLIVTPWENVPICRKHEAYEEGRNTVGPGSRENVYNWGYDCIYNGRVLIVCIRVVVETEVGGLEVFLKGIPENLL